MRGRLCGEGCEHRKQWIENRLQELAGIFALDVAGYAVLDNHMHVVLKLNDNVAADWSDEDAARRCCSSVLFVGGGSCFHRVARIANHWKTNRFGSCRLEDRRESGGMGSGISANINLEGYLRLLKVARRSGHSL